MGVPSIVKDRGSQMGVGVYLLVMSLRTCLDVLTRVVWTVMVLCL